MSVQMVFVNYKNINRNERNLRTTMLIFDNAKLLQAKKNNEGVVIHIVGYFSKPEEIC